MCLNVLKLTSRGSVSYGLTSTRPGQAEQNPQAWVEVSVCTTWSMWCERQQDLVAISDLQREHED